ncbi:MAG: prolyl oligopeptidase family serine peptidase [candidate division Zixibacteria bacterium]|nr:prolyl oligopeptidase family serine peptidase [candidate division Zixibacteria bacterium]
MNTDSSLELSTNNDLFIVSAEGGTYTRITGNPANDAAPHYSPDGKYIAYKAMSRPGFESDKNVLTLYNRKNGGTVKLTEDFPLSVGDIIWASNSKEIYFTAIESGHVSLYKLPLKKRNIEKVLSGAVHWKFQLFPDNRGLCYIKIAADRPGEIYTFDIKNGTEVRLTYYTENLFSKLDVQPPEHFCFEGADGDSIHGMLTYPPGFDESRKYPLVLLIHGGPQWTWLDEFNYYGWNKYLVAAQDYIVVQIDPHGSRGYGQDFTDAVSKDWGGKDYRDLMMGLDYLIAEHDFIDENKLAAMGRSYGGYMTNWIEGQTGRFKCLVTVDGLFDLISAYYTTEELWFPEWEMGGPPWEDPRLYGERSPIAYLENFKTPMLIVHGQKDYRVDLSQALGMFTVLQRKGVESRLLYFPDEGHSIHGMKNLEYFYEVQFDWLAKYLKD